MGHSHGDHESDEMLRRGLLAVVAVAAALAVLGMVVWWPRGPAPELNAGVRFEYVDATVTSIELGRCTSIEVPDAFTDCQTVTAQVTSGETDGSVASFRIYETEIDKPELEVGDGVVLQRNPQVDPSIAYAFLDYQRSPPLLLLTALFVVVVVLLGRLAGLRALMGIVVSFAVIFLFLLPSLLRGNPALPVAMAATVGIAVVVLYLAHGVRPTTTVALVGTLVSLVVVAVLAQVFVELAELTGLSTSESQILRVTNASVDLRALLVAAMVIGALGVLDDVTVTQVGAVTELRRARPDASRRELYHSALRIGRDHIASTVNTLVLAYAGASLPLLLVFVESDRPWSRMATSEVVAVEIVRTLVGSIGLVLAVPVTTGLACLLLARADRSDERPGGKVADGDGADGAGARVDGADGVGSPPAHAEGWDGFRPEEDPW
jgi:uncharacterized membrane protein